MVGLSCYILIDTLFISLALGAPGLAALNLSISVFSIISGVGQMIGIGGGTDFSLRLGEGKDANAAFHAALVCSAAASAVFFLIGLFFDPRHVASWLSSSVNDSFKAVFQVRLKIKYRITFP